MERFLAPAPLLEARVLRALGTVALRYYGFRSLGFGVRVWGPRARAGAYHRVLLLKSFGSVCADLEALGSTGWHSPKQ